MTNRYPPPVRKAFFSYLQEGWSIKAACEKVGISYPTGLQWSNSEKNPLAYQWRQLATERKLPAPVRDLKGTPYFALHDFKLFRKYYLGRESTPWQAEAAQSILRWVNSKDTEFVVINCPPGSGKSTLFTHDIPVWLIVRDRSIRIMIGSSNMRMASTYSGRIRRTLERTRPLELAEGCIAKDYGRFRPETQDIWRREEFVVLPLDGSSPEDKEPTVSAFGMETEFLGTRANFVVWDDLVTNRTMNTQEKIEKQRLWWDTEGETRLEPGGCLLLQGQRMGPEDLYAYALSQTMDEEEVDDEGNRTRYRHIIYPAHFDDRCNNDHGKNAKPFPEGCLLDPWRLPWHGKNGLATIRRNKESKYRVQYQQEDVDPENVLIQKIWITGGSDSSGEQHPGCLDTDRRIGEIPSGLVPPVYSIATADPSATNYWSIQWWLYQPETHLRYLLDIFRGKMDSPDFLDYIAATGSYVGIVDDWQRRSLQMGYPISHWIVENNAAQRFLLRWDFVRRWQRAHNVIIIGHTTTGRVHKPMEEEYGIGMLKNVYRLGMCRLPYLNDLSRAKVQQLIYEATHYPDCSTNDCLMAQWFLEFHLPTLAVEKHSIRKLRRPSWVRAAARA